MLRLMVLLWLASSGVVAATPSPEAAPDASPPPVTPDPAQTTLTPGLMLQAQGVVGDSPVKAWRDGEMAGSLRRVRPELDAQRGALRARLAAELASGHLELLDAWVAGRAGDVAWRVGQQTMPLTIYRQASIRTLPRVDWPLASRYLGMERQVGLSATWTRPRFELAGGLFEGRNARIAHAIGPATILTGAPQVARPGALHPELILRGLVRTPDERVWLSASLAWDARPTFAEDFSARLIAEGGGHAGPLTLRLAAMAGQLEVSPETHAQAWLWGAIAETQARLHPDWSALVGATGIALSAPLRDATREREVSHPDARAELNLALAWQPLNAPYSVRGELVRYMSFSASQPAREDNALRLLAQWVF